MTIAPVIALNSVDWENRRLGTCGPILYNVKVEIINPDTLAVLPADTEGEITVMGPSVMTGYRNNVAANQEVFIYKNNNQDRFFRTGDLGKLVEGKVSFTD